MIYPIFIAAFTLPLLLSIVLGLGIHFFLKETRHKKILWLTVFAFNVIALISLQIFFFRSAEIF